MNSKIIAGIAGSIIAVAVFAYFASVQTNDEVEEILGAGLQNANKCINGDFKADPTKDTVEILMDAYQWRFGYCSITVYEGQTVMITLQSLDVPHGFAIDGYPEIGSKHISPNAQTVVKFTADKTGIFTYFCTVFCGEGHPLHKGQLVVQSA
jgi:cytochrome c oxidase subunit 2